MFLPEYHHLVIKPKIDLIIEEGVESVGDLTIKFNKAFACKVSKSRMSEWLKTIGYKLVRTVHIEGAHPPPRLPVRRDPTPSSQPPDPSLFPAPRAQAFNFPAPGSVFANVAMPGFQE